MAVIREGAARVEIPTNARVFIAGKTGTGKSYLAETYLRGYKYVVKLDTKGETLERKREGKSAWRGLVEGKDFTVCYKLQELQFANTDKIIYCPDFEEQTMEYYDSFFEWVYNRENCIVWIDELMSICPNSMRYPLYLKAIMTRGRSKNVGVWALTQRPVDIPAIVTANSEIFISFDLMLEQDRYKMAYVTGVPDFKYRPSSPAYPYAYWYFQADWENAIKAQLEE